MNFSNRTESRANSPKVDEYLPAAINRAVIQAGLKHPITIYPIALGISSGVVGVLFNIPLLLTIALGLVLSGPVWAVSQIFFRHDAIGSQYLAALHRKQKQYETYLIDKIESGLKECTHTKELKSTASIAIAQLKSIQIKLLNVQELLGIKLRPNEITYGRFLGAAEQVSLSVLDNLNTVVSILKSAASIDLKYVHARLKEIADRKTKSKEDKVQQKSLQERLNLWNNQRQKVDQLMAHNEEAMTEMEHISAAIAQWHTDFKFASSDFESAIKQLQALALQAQKYEDL
jgi:hypothetical protein